MANDGFIEFLSPNALAQLKEASAIVDKLVPQIEKISSYKAPKTPSGADSTAKEMEKALMAQEKAMEKARVGLQKLADAQKQAESKRIASINAEWAAYEKAKSKEKELSDKLLATEIANAEKAAKAEIDKNNKITQAAEKRAERERQIEERKAATILAAQQKQIERQAAIDAKTATTDTSSKLAMISSLNKQRYLEEQKLANDAEKAMSHKYQEELRLARQKQELIASLGKQQQKEINDAEKVAKATERSALANQRLSDAYGKLNAQRNQAARTLQNLIASETASNAEIRKAQREFDTLNNKVKKADQAVGNFSRNVGNYKNALSGATQLMSAFGIATGLALGADLVKNVFQTTKELQSLDLALKMVSETQDRYAANTSFVRELSERWGIEIKGLTEQFTQFYVNAKGKLSEDAIRKSFEGIAKAGSLMGISIDKQNDAFYAFNQMLSKGTVQAEELKKQLGNALPGAIKAATMAYQELNPNLKVTEQMMLDQMKAGKLVSNEMVPAIIRAYQKLYGIENVNGVDTLSAATNRLSNSWTELIRSLNESETGGISKFFNIVITGLDGILQGLRYINESALQGRERILKMLENNAYQQYYQGIKDLQNEDLENTKNYNSEKILENASLINKLTQQNKDYAKDATLGGAQRYELTQSNIKQIQELNNLTSRLKGENRAINDVLKERIKTSTPKEVKPLTDEEIAARKKALKEQAQLEEELRRNAYERKISDLERSKEQIKDIKDSELSSLSERLEMEDAFAFKQIQINQAVYDEKIRLAKKEYDEKYKLVKGNVAQEEKLLKYKNNLEAIALNNLLTANEDALAASLANQAKLKEEALKAEIEKTKEWYKKNPPMFIQNDEFKKQAKKFKKNTDEFKKQNDELRKHAEETKKILDDLKNAFNDYIQGFNEEFFSNAGFGRTFDFFQRMDEDGKTMFDRLGELADGSVEKYAATFQSISESAQEMFNFINQQSQQRFQYEKEKLSQETQIALAFAKESDTARAEIERQAEERRKEIAEKEFKAKKQQAIFNIAIDTAQAIVASVSQSPLTFGLPFSAIAAAIGAAQIAVVQAQQVPAFKDGGVHDGGTMLVNDGSGSNYKETIQTPDGKIYQPKERNVLMNAPKGTKIFTHDQWQKNLDNILTSNSINYSQPNVVVNSGMSDEQVDRIVSTIANKQESHLSLDKSGIKQYVSNGHTKKEIINNQVTFGR
jgi:tape measure domain-containing protein